MARRSLALLVAVYAGCVGCDDRSEGRPGVPIIVQVRDAAGVMVAGIDVASTFDGVFIDMARTGADGTVEIRVQSGGELTALRRDGYHIGITTILDVADDRLQVIPVERADDATPAVSLPVTVTLGTAGLAGNGRVDAGLCRTFDPFPGTVVAEVHPDCIQSDGTVSLTAVSVAGTALKNVRGLGILLDVPLDANAPAVLVVSTAALAITEVPLAVTGPTTAGAGWAVVGVRKGQPIGAAPEGLFAALPGDYRSRPAGQLHRGAALLERRQRRLAQLVPGGAASGGRGEPPPAGAADARGAREHGARSGRGHAGRPGLCLRRLDRRLPR